MDKLTLAQVDSDVAGVVGRPERNEIAGPHVSKHYRDAQVDLFFCRAGQIDPKEVLVNRLDKSRTIDAAVVFAAQQVGSALPAAVFRAD